MNEYIYKLTDLKRSILQKERVWSKQEMKAVKKQFEYQLKEKNLAFRHLLQMFMDKSTQTPHKQLY